MIKWLFLQEIFKITLLRSQFFFIFGCNKHVPVGDQKPTGEWEQQEQHSQV